MRDQHSRPSESAGREGRSVIDVMEQPISRFALVWIVLCSLSFAISLTVLMLDRTTPSAVSRVWLGTALVLAVLGCLWWTQPRPRSGRLSINRYEPISLSILSAPLLLISWLVTAASYLSDEIHLILLSTFSLGRLATSGSWPVLAFAVGVLIYVVAWIQRDLAQSIGVGLAARKALPVTASRLRLTLPIGVLAMGLLLSAASLTAINVNYWRYWATVDGWFVTGHYTATLTDALHVASGGVSSYFISFPLLPSLLSATFGIFGHNTLAAYLPIIVGSTLLALGMYLAAKELTGSSLLGLLFGCVGVTFPLLRSYTLDVGEADGLLMAALVFAAHFRLRADSDGHGTATLPVVSGLAASIAAFARPEGILYMGAMYLTTFSEKWRHREFWLSCVAFTIPCAAFSAVVLREFGMVWPGNHSSTIDLGNFGRTLWVVQDARVFGRYASALSMPDAVLALLLVLFVAAILVCSYWMLRRDRRLLFLPLAALGNVMMVFFVGPIPAEAGKYHDFFRHISFGIPYLVLTLAYGVGQLRGHSGLRQSGRLEWVCALILGMWVLGQLFLLSGPVTPGRANQNPLLTSDIHIVAPELVADRYPLPVMAFKPSDGRLIPDAEEYMAAYPSNVADHYAKADVRVARNSAEYYGASALLFVVFFFLAVISGHISKYEEKGAADPLASFGNKPRA